MGSEIDIELAINTGNSSIIVNLLNNGFNPNEIKTESGYSALLMSVMRQDNLLLEKVLECGADPNIYTGISPLILSIESDNFFAFNLLLEHGASLNVVEPETRDTVLHLLIRKNKIKEIKKVLEKGVDTLQINAQGRSVLHEFLNIPLLEIDILKIILLNRKLINLTDIRGESPLSKFKKVLQRKTFTLEDQGVVLEMLSILEKEELLATSSKISSNSVSIFV